MTRTDAEKAATSKEAQILGLMGALSFIVGYAKSAADNPYDHDPKYYRGDFKRIADKANEALEHWREQVTLETEALTASRQAKRDGAFRSIRIRQGDEYG